jgi:hypothetical protein
MPPGKDVLFIFGAGLVELGLVPSKLVSGCQGFLFVACGNLEALLLPALFTKMEVCLIEVQLRQHVALITLLPSLQVNALTFLGTTASERRQKYPPAT